MIKQLFYFISASIPIGILCLSNVFSSPPPQSTDKQVAGHTVIKRLIENKSTNASNLRFPRIIYQDQKGLFWIGTGSGLYTYNEDQEKWTILNDVPGLEFLMRAQRVIQDKADRIWVQAATEPNLSYFDGQGWNTIYKLNPPAPLKEASPIFVGLDSKLWFFLGHSLIAFDGNRWTSLFELPSTIRDSYSRMPMSYRNRREEMIDRIRNKLRETDKAEKEPAFEVGQFPVGLQDREGIIWLGGRKAVIRFEPVKRDWRILQLPDNLVEVYGIYEGRDGRIWLADSNGHISVYDKKKDKWLTYDIVKEAKIRIRDEEDSSFYIDAIYQDKQGQMMLGSELGLITFTEAENRGQVYTFTNSGLPGGDITAIYEDKLGRIWVGTSRGVIVLEQ